MSPASRRRPSRGIGLVVWLLTSCLVPCAAEADTETETVVDSPAPSITFVADRETPDLVRVAISGLDEDSLRRLAELEPDLATWKEILSVVARDPAHPLENPPSLLGRWLVEAGQLCFSPRFPPAPGLELEARFDGAAFDRAIASPSATPSVTARHRLPVLDRRASTRVLAIHPGSQTLPANLLRIYVHFSAPMSARHVVPHIRLLDSSGRPVPLAFVEIPEGLWDPQRRRLTLLIHPGRVKRGVGPNTVLGPVLEPGKDYRLEISSRALDADALPLAEDFVHSFQAGAPDQRAPAPESWRLELPAVPSEPLEAHLPEPADHALLERLLFVEDTVGQRLAGRTEVDERAMRWRFFPAGHWKPGSYHLVVPHGLEDPAGNRVDRLFEVAGEPTSAERANEEPTDATRLAFDITLH